MTLIKNNKWKVLISSLLILSPIVAGLILWNKLPESVPIHWGINGEPDSFASKGFAVFSMPLILLAFHWVCLLGTSLDKKNKNQNKKVFGFIFWIIPIITIVVQTSVYLTALNVPVDITNIIICLFAAIFIFVGNYMPKTTHNYTIGIKIPWTIKDESNWDATHRFAGKLWVICGVLAFGVTFIPAPIKLWVLFGLVAVAVLPPFVYSYIYYRKHK